MRKNLGVKQLLYPQAVALIGSYDENNVPDIMVAAWISMADFDKVLLVSVKNISPLKIF